MQQDLAFNRQFIVSPRSIAGPPDWKRVKTGKVHHLYAHPNLELTIAEKDDRQMILLGFIFDAYNPGLTNAQILNRIIEEDDFKTCLEASFNYGGKFVVFYCDKNDHVVFHDAAGLREIFYLRTSEGLWMASQPTLINEFIELKFDNTPLKEAFYQSEAFKKRGERILDTTQYKDVFHLSSNHLLDINSGQAERYYPSKTLEAVPLAEAVDRSVEYLKGFMEAAGIRYKLLIAVTGGWDSRMMLAANCAIDKSAHYFILKHKHMSDSSLDIRTPKNLFRKLGMPFDIIEYAPDIETKVKNRFLKNTELCNKKLIPALNNVFLERFPDYLNITSVSEVGRNYFHYQAFGKRITPKLISYLNRFKGFRFVDNEYAKWIRDSGPIFKSCGYSMLDMFYWEEKMGNWLANGRSGMANAIEDFSLFNCKNFMTLLLSVDSKYRNRYHPTLHLEIIKKLYPEVLCEPINRTNRYRIMSVMIKLKIYPLYKWLQSKIS